MTLTPPPSRPSLVTRVQNILMRPTPEWAVIRDEPATVQSLFTGYACILALIPAICGLLATALWTAGFGFGLLGPAALIGAAMGYVLGLVAVFVFGLIIEALAGGFDSTKDRVQAMKVAVYSATAGWVGGVLSLIPVIGGLLALLAGLYGIYLLYTGLQQVLSTPKDKAIAFTAVSIVIYIVIMVVIGMIIGAVTAALAVGAAVGAAGIGMAAFN